MRIQNTTITAERSLFCQNIQVLISFTVNVVDTGGRACNKKSEYHKGEMNKIRHHDFASSSM